MKNVLRIGIATVLIFLLSGTITYGFSDEWIEKTVVEKEFDITKDAKLIIDHEFGKVVCENWDKDIISVMVTVRVNSSDESKAAKIIDDVIVDVKGNTNKVEAFCELNQKYQKNKNIQVSIDFYIKMPETVSLDLENSFGSAFIETVSGPASISNEYGKLEVIALNNVDNNIEIGFGKGDIKYIAGGNLEISYSSLKLDGSETLSLESEYSTVNIGKVKTLSCEVEGGSTRIEYVENIELESSFSEVVIDEISGFFSGETEYGSLTVKHISTDFQSVRLDNSYGSVDLNFDADASYNLVAKSSFCKISFDENNAEINYRNSSMESTEIKGVIGKGKSESTVTVTSEFGAVSIGNK